MGQATTRKPRDADAAPGGSTAQRQLRRKFATPRPILEENAGFTLGALRASAPKPAAPGDIGEATRAPRRTRPPRAERTACALNYRAVIEVDRWALTESLLTGLRVAERDCGRFTVLPIHILLHVATKLRGRPRAFHVLAGKTWVKESTSLRRAPRGAASAVERRKRRREASGAVRPPVTTTVRPRRGESPHRPVSTSGTR
jgi:hypothetical protein